jgi:hypothetical protein
MPSDLFDKDVSNTLIDAFKKVKEINAILNNYKKTINLNL